VSRIVCVDLNRVLDDYAGWVDDRHFDPPRTGARAFLQALRDRGFDVVIFTTVTRTMFAPGCAGSNSMTWSAT